MTRTIFLAAMLAASRADASSGAVDLSTGGSIADKACAITGPAVMFQPEAPAVFARAVLRGTGRQRVRVEWIDPVGSVASEATWADVPGGACLITQLPLAGFPAAQKPGNWTVRVLVGERLAAHRRFGIARNMNQDPAVQIASVTAGTAGGLTELSLAGSGFRPGAVVHVARFTEAGGWQYLAVESPLQLSPAALTVRTRTLDPGEYIAVIRGADGFVSAPARFVVSTGRSYQLPVPPTEEWSITQGPYGSFSHWNRSIHAYDIAPLRGRYVTAMRAGVAHTHDLGMHQTTRLRSFGNYITIDHGDGEYSHYAHLATGKFLVHDGERIEQGQPIAVVGNSGYTLGPGGGYHVHVHVTRSPEIIAQSIPFQFDKERPVTGQGAVARAASPPKGRPGSVQVTQWWTELMTVPPRTGVLDVRLLWDSPTTGLDLHLVSPSGRHYGWYGDKTGYSGSPSRPQEFRLANPEAGSWRVAVQGVLGGPEPIDFRVESELKPKAPRDR